MRPGGKPPVIGITTDIREENGRRVQHVDDAYVTAVERSGGTPLIVPIVDRAQSPAVVDRLDGLIITGGRGITEGLVGELPDELPPVDERRYRADALMLEAAGTGSTPVLGICYGMQLINARRGGTLFGDVERQLQGSARHTPARNAGRPVTHPVEVVVGTRLQQALSGRQTAAVAGPSTTMTNSHHFQAVERIGDGLRANAYSADGVIEGLESDDGAIMGVQFHPERMAASVWDCLFDDLLDRARRAQAGPA